MYVIMSSAHSHNSCSLTQLVHTMCYVLCMSAYLSPCMCGSQPMLTCQVLVVMVMYATSIHSLDFGLVSPCLSNECLCIAEMPSSLQGLWSPNLGGHVLGSLPL